MTETTHAVPVYPGDAAVLVTPAGEELHLDSRTLAMILDRIEAGNDAEDDDARDMPEDDEDREDRLDGVAQVEDIVEWINTRCPTTRCTGVPDRIDTPAVHAQLRDVLDMMTGRAS